MTRPVIIRRPQVVLQPLDAAGAAVGTPIDVTCDITAVELSPDQSIDTISTFCGPFRVAGDVSTEATISGILTPDTETNWAPLVGDSVEVRIFARLDSTRYRRFVSEVPFDPSLYGTNDAEESTRAWEMDLPVYSDVTWVNVV